MSKNQTFINWFTIILFGLSTFSCGIYKPVDTRKVPVNVNKRVEKNIQEGRGFRIFDANKNKGGGVFEFASANPLWRASLEILDFAPFSNVDYSGGILITDWFSDNQEFSDETVKISVRFLSNEVRSDALDIKIYKKTCNNLNKCKIAKLDSVIVNDIKKAILKDAAVLAQNDMKNNSSSDYKSLESLIDK